MEGMWFMHQLTAAACYKVAESKSRWVTDYHLAFRNDWTEVLREWWVQPSESNYGLLFGDMELHSAIVNLRSCAQVAFTRLGIQDRMFPRPLTLDDEDGLVGGDLNSKIGHELLL
ncbi:hypothetical protein Ocin01_19224 [Orchesella cincta]|uniref:Uncharacterized protein n=1 Tax=Orchesella cincta TaxID=48709 RepID=A0A1D2M3A3_ORCCI|nr:hypothetical protein Ocin01_19224 [Orchesella cincta]